MVLVSLESLKSYDSNKFVFFSYFFKTFGNPSVIFYPCCGFDTTPSRIFANVKYFDKNVKAYEFIKEHNLNISCLDVTNFRKKECDLLLLFNPSISLDILLKSFNPHYILCNNLHNTANDLINNRSFALTHSYFDIYLFRKI